MARVNTAPERNREESKDLTWGSDVKEKLGDGEAGSRGIPSVQQQFREREKKGEQEIFTEITLTSPELKRDEKPWN